MHVLVKSTRMDIRSFIIQLITLLLLLFQLVKSEPGTDEGDDAVQFKDCPEDIFADSSRCNSPGIYYANIDGEVCRTTVNSTSTGCYQAQITFQLNTTLEEMEEEGQSSRGLRSSPSGCPRRGHRVIPTHASPASSCYSYSIPVCEGGRHELTIVTMGGTDATRYTSCYDIKINNKTIPRVIYYNLLQEQVCPRTEVVIALKLNQELTELRNGKTQTFQITKGKFNLVVCFHTCGNASGSLQVSRVSMAKLGGGPVKDCKQDEEIYSNCKHYNGTNPSICWGRGCQYLKKDSGRCITGTLSCEARTYKKCICSHKFCENLDTEECSPSSPILQNKLSCRRANSYYIYHPKTACYSEEDSGNCTATATYAVNLHGKGLTDQRGIQYIADVDSGFRDPHRARELKNECRKNMAGVSHLETIQLYSDVIVGYRHGKPDRHGLCIYYPIPICQNGEYMLTVKMTEGFYKKPHRRCTEVRVNDVPVMIHMDNFILGGNRSCVPTDVVLMFLAVGGKDNNPKSDYTLHLKGHVEPIQVKGGQMDLQFCIGWECFADDNPMISAFTLERLGPETKACKRAPG